MGMSQIWTADMMSQPSNDQDRRTHPVPMVASSIRRTYSLRIIEPVVPFHDGKKAFHVSPHATAQSAHRFMRRTIASGRELPHAHD
jgi:hypothetical protein